jgi:hypothetical protein
MNLFENYKAYLVKEPIAVTADEQTTGVDLGPELLDDVMVIMTIGAVSGTTPTLDVDIETSDALAGTYTAAKSFSQYDADDADSLKSLSVNLQGQNSNGEEQRYLRANIDVGGTTPSFVLGIIALVESQVGKSDLNSQAAA